MEGGGYISILSLTFQFEPQNEFLGKLKMARSDQTVHQRKKSRKQNSLVSMRYNFLLL